MSSLPDQPLRAALWMSGAVGSFTLMAVAGRAVQAELTTFELMFWRSVIGLVLVAVFATLSGAGVGQLRSAQPRLHAVRHVVHFAGQNLWFFGIMVIPLAQLVALEFTSPIWVVVLAPLLLGERFTRRKLGLAALGFVGVLIVARPGVQPLEAGHLAGIAAALCFALNVILTKRLMRRDTVLCVLFWMSLTQAAMALVLSLWGGFTWPGAALVPWLVVLGLTGLSAHYCLTSALSVAPASIVAPMEFIRLPVIALVGVWLYGEALEWAVLVGAGVIFAANLLNARGPGTARA